VVVYLLVVRPVKRHFITTLKQLPKRAVSAVETGSAEGGGVLVGVAESSDARRVQALKKQVVEKVVSQPAAASRLVQGWIGEGGH
jgi:hypothetical protein